MRPKNTTGKLCACGCGRPVKLAQSTYVSGHQETVRTLHEAVAAYLARCVWVNGCLNGPFPRYGDICFRTEGRGSRRTTAHRAVYLAAHGPIARGLVVRHCCDNRSCVNIEHLELGTDAQNMRDIYDRSRRQPRTWAEGTQRPNAVLTETLVSELRDRARAGEALGSLATEYGVNYGSLASAVRGRTWRHVSTPPVAGVTRKASRNALTKTQPEQCLAAAALADEGGLSLDEIAAQLGTTRATAWRLVSGGRALGVYRSKLYRAAS